MDLENTHWRQLCPSILDIEAEDGISKMSRKTSRLSLTNITSPKSCHRGNVEGEDSEECETERRESIDHVAELFFCTRKSLD